MRRVYRIWVSTPQLTFSSATALINVLLMPRLSPRSSKPRAIISGKPSDCGREWLPELSIASDRGTAVDIDLCLACLRDKGGEGSGTSIAMLRML